MATVNPEAEKNLEEYILERFRRDSISKPPLNIPPDS